MEEDLVVPDLTDIPEDDSAEPTNADTEHLATEEAVATEEDSE